MQTLFAAVQACGEFRAELAEHDHSFEENRVLTRRTVSRVEGLLRADKQSFVIGYGGEAAANGRG